MTFVVKVKTGASPLHWRNRSRSTLHFPLYTVQARRCPKVGLPRPKVWNCWADLVKLPFPKLLKLTQALNHYGGSLQWTFISCKVLWCMVKGKHKRQKWQCDGTLGWPVMHRDQSPGGSLNPGIDYTHSHWEKCRGDHEWMLDGCLRRQTL